MEKKVNIAIFLWVLLAVGVRAQSLSVSAPSRVAVGENFRVAYTVNTQDVDDFRSGLQSTEEVDVIAGPYTSSQSSFQVMNGHSSSTSSITYTYTLYAQKAGTYTVPVAHARVNGKNIQSHAVKIAITGSGRPKSGTPKMHEDDDGQAQMRAAGTPISGNDLFIKVSANKKRVHEQEPILLTYKVYTLVELTQLEGKMPDLTGFHTQEVKLPQQKSFHVENVNGRNYRCVTWSQYVMYPQMTGKLEIPSITFKGIVVQQNRSVDPFEAFFNGGSGYVEVKREIKAPGLVVQVDPLPARPSNFSGGVGRLNISAQVDKSEVKAGDPVSLRVVVGGVGNLKLLKQPAIQAPKDFDVYDPKVTDKTSLTANGVEGNMIYDFLLVPRNQGRYNIPPVELVYYDTAENKYKTVKTQGFDIKVAPGDGKGTVSSASYETQKENDIRGLKKGTTRYHDVRGFFFASWAYWMALLLPLLLFAVAVFLFRKRARYQADAVRVKGRKANKIATKRLRKARQLMAQGKSNEFFDEVLRALWGYVGDKLNMPVEQLSRDNISERLLAREVDEGTVGQFLSALDECEFERYAPGDAKGNMSKTFASAMTAITNIETVMKKKVKRAPAATAGLVLLLLLGSVASAGAVTKDSADREYIKGNYQQAIKDYNELLRKGGSADVYYNLGNAYFRTENLPQAILAYERARQLSPADRDINFNLQFAQSKTIDKIAPETEMFFFTWYRSVVSLLSVDGWAFVAVGALVLALLSLLLFLFSSAMALRKTGFYGAIVSACLFLLANLFAFQQKWQQENRSGAIVVVPAVNVKKTPSSAGTDEFVVHEGTRVTITDKALKGWRGIRLADGREGWVMEKQIEEI